MNNLHEVDLNVFTDKEILRLRDSALKQICFTLECMVDYAKDDDVGEVSYMVTDLKASINDFWLYDTESFDRGLKDGSR